MNVRSFAKALSVLAVGSLVAGQAALAQPRDDHRREEEHRAAVRHEIVRRGPPVAYRHFEVPRDRHFHNIWIRRFHGPLYPGFGFFYTDDEAWRFLGLTAFSLATFDLLNEQQERAHEEAWIEATSAPIGDPIIWNEGPASGSVVTLREGHTPDGRTCREFQQEVTINGQPQQAHGTACMQPDGSWQVTDNQ